MQKNDVYKLDAHTLRVFLKVCELKSVSRASDFFDINQSTVSNILDRLRQSLGYKLFEKVGRNIEPTENAKALIPRAEQIVSAIEGLPDTGTYDPKEDMRPITLAGNLNSMMPALTAIREAIWAVCPDRHVRFLELGSRDQMEAFLSYGLADFLVAVRTAHYPPALTSAPLFTDTTVAYYDPSVRPAPDTDERYFEARHAVLDFGGNVRSTVANEVKRVQGHRNVVLSAGNVSVLAGLMRGTDVIASMPSHLSSNVMQEFACCAVPALSGITLYFDLLWHKRNTDSSRHKWISDIILSLDFDQRLSLPRATAAAGSAA
ncbi:LysR family transcriptional regulator [Cognatishimia sp. SS12]|uniref:LysR family transcriptional regulator n=1 Tax=Cognatishimia sp. SS12 TaxID=2979465 RepID=UPI00232F8150|nr:LysR family transcriptional regulator [Cognatishimia sp. SS12]MDC0738717.1 LysR family transcriptional regulator [Cognatishimia sp. SS12]